MFGLPPSQKACCVYSPVCAPSVCVRASPLPDSNRLIQQTGSERDRNVFSLEPWLGEAAVAPLPSSPAAACLLPAL